MATQWETFEHEADIGVRGRGPSRETAFEQAALALTAVVTDPASVQPKERVEMACEGGDDEILLVAWLNAIIYEMAVRRMLFGRYQVRIDGRRLHGTAWGEPIDVSRHQPAAEIKGATYTALAVRPEGREWSAQCVVDV